MEDLELRPRPDSTNDETGNGIISSQTTPKVKKPLKERVSDFFKNPRKRLIFIIVLGLVLIGAVGTNLYFMLKEPATTPITTVKKAKNEFASSVVPSPLDGTMIDSATALKHPLAIVIENHTDARPQSGLDKASIVYEAIAEGGITRFLALFSNNEAEKVGPVRSARTFFVDWAHGYNAFLAHVGGNIDALDKIQAEKTLDLDQFRYPSSYWREYAAGLATEHTMYTSTVKLREQAAKNNYSNANNFSLYKFKDEPTETEKAVLPESQTVDLNISSAQYNVQFVYDKASNSYKRNMAGKPHTDKVSKNQINPKNVIVMTVARKAVLTRINEPGYEMTTVGTGTAKIFLDGKTITGKWKKNTSADREIFYDEAGNEIVFNRGSFWITIIPPESSVNVK